MTLLDVALLGLIQGLTEFLPVSSSGHLVIASSLLGYEAEGSTLLEVAVHLGTVLAVVVFFFRDLGDLVRATPRLLKPVSWSRQGARDDPATFMLILLGISAIPAGVMGLFFKDRIQALFDSPQFACFGLIATGLILLSTALYKPGTSRVRLPSAIIMGLAQAVALIPGISRSGSTISAGLAMGVAREEVGRFAFLMSIIPILGASLLEVLDYEPTDIAVSTLAVGITVAFASGLFALNLLMRFVARGRLIVFAPYCIAVGLLGILLG